MQLNQILQPFTQANNEPQVFTKATFEELLATNGQLYYLYEFDVPTDMRRQNIEARFDPSIVDGIENAAKDISKAIKESNHAVYLCCIDDTRTDRHGSSKKINKPKFFLNLASNSWYSKDIDFSIFSVKRFAYVSRREKSNSYYANQDTVHKHWLLEVEFAGLSYVIQCLPRDIKRFGNFRVSADGCIKIQNAECQFTPVQLYEYLKEQDYYIGRSEGLDYRLVNSLWQQKYFNKVELQKFITFLMNSPYKWNANVGIGSGISKTYLKNVEPHLIQLKQQYPVQYCMMETLKKEAGKTVDSVKLSTIFNATFEIVKDVHDLADKIWFSAEIPSGFEDWYKNQPSYKDQRRKVLKSQGNRAITKIMEEVDSLNLDSAKYPKTYEAITSGEIPLGTFFRKSEQYFIFNDNWALWEEMLAKHPDVTKEIAKSAAPRTTYEKDLMSYFYFVLYSLPEYLKAQTKEKWTCIPRLVDSPNELEPPKEEAGGTPGVTRQRSALTPIVDNDKKTVVVPYASLALHGRQTTYCYSLDYQVLRKGFSFKGNVVMSDVEEKLNGRDDYGLMFYTLTGSEQGRGYPTFLIIFERRKNGTHVHFHRTHPSRSKDGDYNPIHNWTRVCYNWMIGNVARENIIAQQGDLAFVKTDDTGKRDFSEMVKAYDNHIFAAPIYFSPNTSASKNNVLGYVKVTEDNTLQHHEHEWVTIPLGVYEVRQCRSWEANPKGVWSLRID